MHPNRTPRHCILYDGSFSQFDRQSEKYKVSYLAVRNTTSHIIRKVTFGADYSTSDMKLLLACVGAISLCAGHPRVM